MRFATRIPRQQQMRAYAVPDKASRADLRLEAEKAVAEFDARRLVNVGKRPWVKAKRNQISLWFQLDWRWSESAANSSRLGNSEIYREKTLRGPLVRPPQAKNMEMPLRFPTSGTGKS